MRLFNTLTRQKETFTPLTPEKVGIYSCGPTVYDVPHIGNYRFFVWVDVLHRYLVWRGYEVTLVINITDVEDKTIASAAREEIPLREYTDRYAQAFLDGLDALGALPADRYPRATDHVAEMLELVERLISKGHAYQASGSVFFRVDSFPDYGSLARLEPEEMRATERVEGDEFGKEDPRDFTLWKAAKEGEPAWESPYGSGRPGWHLECSAMSMKYLGTTFDLHLGGVDLIFPHHENEIAQSVGATGEPFARSWLHCSHLLVDGTKMSKSLGNFYTLQQLLEAGHDPVALRYLLASVHYRRQLNFTWEALESASASIARARELVGRLEQERGALPQAVGAGNAGAQLAAASEGFVACLDDDLNTSGALGHVFSLVRETNTALDAGSIDRKTADAIIEWFRDIDRIWGILPAADSQREIRLVHAGKELLAVGPRLTADLEELVVARLRARADRDFATADTLRARLADAGVEVEDTAQGARWRLS